MSLRCTATVGPAQIPEFTDLGTKVSQEISGAIAGRQSVDSALKKSQKLAEKISKEYEGR